MSQENPPRRRARSSQDGIGSRTAVVSAAVAVVLVAGGGWAIAHAGNDDKTTDTGARVRPPRHRPRLRPRSHRTRSRPRPKNKPWSTQCGRAAKAASRAGYGVLAPSELPSGWSSDQCHYSSSTGWHVEVSAADQTLAVDQRKGEVAPVVAAVLGPGLPPGQGRPRRGHRHLAVLGQQRREARAVAGAVVQRRRAQRQVAVATLNRLADVLLTYESAPNGNNGG